MKEKEHRDFQVPTTPGGSSCEKQRANSILGSIGAMIQCGTGRE